MKYLALAFAFLLLTGLGAAASIDSTIQQSCPSGYEPLISMEDPDKTFNNPGPPGMYDYQVCVSGIKSSKIVNSCEYNEGFYISSNDTTAHFSSYEAYNIPVCTGQMVTSVQSSCRDNQTELFSVSSDHNAHVAAPGVYDQEVCGFYAPPENVTLEASFNLSSSDQVYFDGSSVEENSFYLAEFPYIVSESDKYVSGIAGSSFVSASRQLEQKNHLSFTRQRASSSFFVPLTRGSHSDIESRQEDIISRSFMNSFKPSFRFYMPEEANVKTLLSPEVNISSDLSLSPGTYTLEIKKTGKNSIEVSRK